MQSLIQKQNGWAMWSAFRVQGFHSGVSMLKGKCTWLGELKVCEEGAVLDTTKPMNSRSLHPFDRKRQNGLNDPNELNVSEIPLVNLPKI